MSAPSRKPQQQQDCTHCAIRDRAICAYCGPQELEQLNAAKSYRGFPKGSSILFAGEESEFVGTIVTGVVALSKSLSDGRRQVVGLQFPSDFLGGAFRQRAPCDAVAATDVLLCMFERRSFLTLIQETPSLRDRMLDLTLDELDALRGWMTLLGLKSAREKVASFLLMLAKRSRPASKGAAFALPAELDIPLPITRGEIGESLGLTIETVSRQFSKLKVEGVIAFGTSRDFRVLDLEALQDAAGEGEA